MNVFSKLLTILVASTIIFTACTLAIAVNELDDDIRLLAQQVEQMDEAVKQAEYDAVQKSLEFAPEGKSIYQLRGDAQTEAQRLLDKLTTKYEIPRYELSGIRFRPALIDSAAGTATGCNSEKIYIMSLNEILFLRNYEEFMYMIIPHEVAHIMTCLQDGYDRKEDESKNQAAHGEEWKQVMLDLGFLEPGNYITHSFNMTPVYEYELDVARRLNKVFNEGELDVSEE